MEDDSAKGRLELTAPLLPLAIGGLAFAAERQEIVSAPVAIAATAVAAAAATWAIVAYAVRGRAIADGERRRLAARLEEIDDRDPLTGVYDRHRLDEEVRRQLAFASRYGARLAVLAIDLDDFESIVDAHGRATGDELLIASAEVLVDELRATDVVARREPHGFVVLIPQSDEDAARIVAGKLIRRLRAIERGRPSGESISLRASIGIALSEPAGLDVAAGLLDRADEALAAARAAGGDRLALTGQPIADRAQGG